MFTLQQYRTKAAEYIELAKASRSPAELLEYEALGRTFTTLANNEQWLADNHANTVHAGQAEDTVGPAAVAEEEEHVLRCLGATVIMEWDTLPMKLQRELFDNAGAMGALLETAIMSRIPSDPREPASTTVVTPPERTCSALNSAGRT